jgi:hypothetical protein
VYLFHFAGSICKALKRLERNAVKVARYVLRGGRGSNPTPLLDNLAAML